MWCGVVWSGVVWCGVVWCGVVWCGVIWCGVVWCGVVWWPQLVLSDCLAAAHVAAFSLCRCTYLGHVLPPQVQVLVSSDLAQVEGQPS